jgi:hypothetical protein
MVEAHNSIEHSGCALTHLRLLALAACIIELTACGGYSGETTRADAAKTFTLGGTVAGLTADGLVLANAGATVTVISGASTFAFSTAVTAGEPYAVTVQSVPKGLTCTVAGAVGIVQTANVNNVVVTCSDQSYSLGGTATGLNTAGLVLANGTDRLSVASDATTFTMPMAVAYTSSYSVAIATQPQGQTCSVQNGTGSMGSANVTDVTVSCSDQPYTLGGSISGLTAPGLVLTNGSDSVQIPPNATSFTFPTASAFSSHYAVTVGAQPAGLTCSVSNSSGTMPAANVATVTVICSNQSYSVGGNITGLSRSGLTLTNGPDTLQVATTATSFTFPTSVAAGAHYQVVISAQPTNSICTVSNASGTIQVTDVTNITVTCATTAYTLGGSISGLTASGLSLSDGSDRLAVAANAALFSMPRGVAPGSAYSMTVASQPSGLRCSVTNGTGTMPGTDLSNVQIACVSRQWTWIAGSNTIGAEGSYGSMGVAASSNQPSERDSSMNWTDSSGRLWLFGGADQYSGRGDLNDLWMFDPGTGLWTWMSGSNTAHSPGTYGTQHIGATNNNPRARHSGATWVDRVGRLWLFGGYTDVTGLSGRLNDLWMYDPVGHLWTWMGGTNTANDAGAYGTRGVAASGNLPPARVNPLSWTDSSGRFWLYGGSDSAGNLFSDLWMYDPGVQLWTWVSGPNTASNAAVVSGSQGSAAGNNTPGARSGAATWADSSGHLWLFGGNDYPGPDLFADLWSYDIATNEWTWVSGSSTPGTPSVSGTLGISAAGNTPGARNQPGFWTDSSGRFWMFGGSGLGDGSNGGGWLSDLWMFDVSTQQWTWVKGPAAGSNAPGIYGTKGVPAAGNVPGGRVFSLGWVDTNDNLWMFGGYGADTQGYHYDLNDLWQF